MFRGIFIKYMNQLKAIGLSKTEIDILQYLYENRDRYVTLREIEFDLGLRQPIVSILTSGFRQNGWVETRIEKLGGRGRPILKIRWNGKAVKDILTRIDKEVAELQRLKKEIKGVFS